MQHTDIPKRKRNAIKARLEASIKKYGFDEVRLITNHRFKEAQEQIKLEKEIAEREEELSNLKKTQ